MASRYDILIIGGGTGGVAAALAAARAGRRVLLTEETDWIGGQLTAQAVPPDENPWIETFGGTRSYRAFREGVRDYYRRHFPLTPAARANPLLNPGDGFVSRLCHEPRVALAVLEAMLAPHVSSGLVTVLLRHVPVAAGTDGDQVTSIALRSLETDCEREFAAPFILDGTETGALLPLAGVEYVVGAESRADTGEPHAPDGPAQPGNQQGVTHCFALSHHPGEDHVIAKPASYDFWRQYQAPFWPGPHLGWSDLHPTTLESRAFSLFGPSDDPERFMTRDQFVWGEQGLWHYRRLRHRANFADDGPPLFAGGDAPLPSPPTAMTTSWSPTWGSWPPCCRAQNRCIQSSRTTAIICGSRSLPGLPTPPNRTVGDRDGTAARYVADSLYEMWRSGVSLVIWQTIRDFTGANPFGGGLYDIHGRPKLMLRAYAFPVMASVAPRARLRLGTRTVRLRRDAGRGGLDERAADGPASARPIPVPTVCFWCASLPASTATTGPAC